jgi:hypothetical protein
MSPTRFLFIPEGWPKIARRFNAGGESGEPVSPEGTAESAHLLSRPFGTKNPLESWSRR